MRPRKQNRLIMYVTRERTHSLNDLSHKVRLVAAVDDAIFAGDQEDDEPDIARKSASLPA